MAFSEETIATYDTSAEQLAEYFAGVGSRIEDIERAIAHTDQEPSTISAVEIGCGDGRDGEEIAKRVGSYRAFDPSIGMLTIARQKLPDIDFVQADALSYEYPPNTDLYFAFASLLHISREDLGSVFQKVESSLRPKGIFYISLKERPKYAEELQEDKYGSRVFYYYNPNLIRRIAGTAFTAVYEDHQTRGETDWFTMALQKQET